jgi:hypothetical protein
MKKTLILKGLGKAKVRKIAREHIINRFNEFIDYQKQVSPETLRAYGYSEKAFTLHLSGEVDAYEGGLLPELGNDEYFTLEDLVSYLGGKI